MNFRLSPNRKHVIAKTFQMFAHINQYPGQKIGISDIVEKCTTMSPQEVHQAILGLADWADEKLEEVANGISSST